ncbi:hypothetical protein F3641_20260 [Escherichia coli]|nr:hypothetical protein [Escherichia coli]
MALLERVRYPRYIDTQITTMESGLRGAEKCNIVAIFQIGLSGTPARNLTEEIRSPGVVPVSGNVAEYR